MARKISIATSRQIHRRIADFFHILYLEIERSEREGFIAEDAAPPVIWVISEAAVINRVL